ncbi:uncharacterized protein LOC105630354 [Jatropha curcas]|uniref:uncharacterized protein LOC105630354 n=1 Tax=Jatropha curcas TaxID=180498 RepID=UPI001893CF33|nr:uncharacterized protein LOC105630354 [Jatropha curcas]
MDPNKSPGLDGLNPAFFQKSWGILGPDISNACRLWLSQGTLPPSLTKTLLVLIPKCDSPEFVKDYRPIALCNLLYKILAKALANRLKMVLPKIISDSQSAFIQDRMITDNFLIAFETIHNLKWRPRGTIESCALKIDMSKAYDRVSWNYLTKMLLALGFSDRWVSWMHMCFAKVTYSVNVNGIEVGPILPGRGLRQGDPISPYLFLIVAEGLSLLLQNAERRGLIHGCRAAANCPRISHLFFADDSLLFFDASLDKASQDSDISAAWRFFATNGVFIRVMMNRFWWNGNKFDGHGINWLSWDRMCVSKSGGGMGFRDLHCFNVALLGKQGWRLLTKTNTLLHHVFKAKYFPRGDFLSASATPGQSFVWKSILSSKQVLIQGSRWRVGNGQNIHVNSSPWIPKDDGFFPDDGQLFIPNAMCVCDLFVPGENRWDVNKLMNLFSIRDLRAILSIPLSIMNREDKIIWHFHKKGIYTVKTAYYEIFNSLRHYQLPSNDSVWNRIWNLHVPPKIRDFMWRACRNILPTRCKLVERGIGVPSACLFCPDNETSDHVLFACPRAREVWRISGFILPSGMLSFNQFFEQVYLNLGRDKAATIATIAWKIWASRNDMLWSNKWLPPALIVRLASDYLHSFVAAQSFPASSPSLTAGRASTSAQMVEGADWLGFTDGAIFPSSDFVGFGCLFEDGEGSFSLAISGFNEGGHDPAIAEALALRQGLLYAVDAFPGPGRMFTDCLCLVQALYSSSIDFSDFGSIVMDCN